MNYDELSDEEREHHSVASLHHISREIHTLVDYRGRINTARAILTAGKPQAARLALMALDGASIDQIMREATTTDGTE